MNIFITSFILYELLRLWIRISILAETGKHHTDLTWLNSYHTEVHQVHQVMHTKFSITKLTNQFTGQRVGHSGKHGDSYFRVNPCQPLWTNPSKLNLYFQFLHFPKIYEFPAAEEKTCLASTCLSSATNANWFMASKGLSAGIPGWSTWKDGSNQANCCGLDFHHPQLSDPLVVSYLRLYDRFQKNILSAMVIAVETPMNSGYLEAIRWVGAQSFLFRGGDLPIPPQISRKIMKYRWFWVYDTGQFLDGTSLPFSSMWAVSISSCMHDDVSAWVRSHVAGLGHFPGSFLCCLWPKMV